jgi:hypothetical protein
MKPRRLFLVLLALPLLTLALCHPAASRADSAFCAIDKPESVLGCISAAFIARDIDAFGRLLAADFTFRTERKGKTDPGGHWTRDQQLKGTASLFSDKGVQSIRHTVTAHKSPKSTGADTWVISGIVTDFTVIQAAHPDQPLDVHATDTTLRVRRVATPEPHFEVYEWIDRSK